MLNRLHLTTANQTLDQIRVVLELIAEASDTKVATDATSRNILTKLQGTLLKLIHDAAGAERGADEDITAVSCTPARSRRTTRRGEDDEEDEATTQLQRELEATRIEEEDETKLTAIGEEYDASQLPDDQEMQSLVDSLGDDEDEEL